MANEGATQHEANTEETRMIISTPSRQMVAMRRDMNVTDIIQMEKKPVLVRIERAERVVGDKGKPIKHWFADDAIAYQIASCTTNGNSVALKPDSRKLPHCPFCLPAHALP